MCELVVRPSVDDVFDGINATVMVTHFDSALRPINMYLGALPQAYGQTGAGKR